MNFHTSLLLIFLCNSNIYAQRTVQDQAIDFANIAVAKMDSGDTKGAIELLEKAQKLDPTNIDIPYEMAYAYMLESNHKKAISILENLTKNSNTNPSIYKMLGNCYDMDKNSKKAIKTYDKGIELFPNYGGLYLERGIMEIGEKNYNTALGYFETGIKRDPKHASNYYWASKIYLGSDQEVWGMIYGELFMNLERNSKRTKEISKLLFDVYKSEIKFNSDTNMNVSFCNNETINITDISDIKNLKLPFGTMIYEPTLLMSIINEEKVTLASLNRIRTSFIKNYFEKGFNKTHTNILFDFHHTLSEKGFLTAYNYWILMMGDENDFDAWLTSNKAEFDRFADWFNENPLEIDEENYFHRTQY